MAWVMQLIAFTAAAVTMAGAGEDFHTALNPVLVPRPFVRILTVMVGPVLVKGPGMELPHNFSVKDSYVTFTKSSRHFELVLILKLSKDKCIMWPSGASRFHSSS